MVIMVKNKISVLILIKFKVSLVFQDAKVQTFYIIYINSKLYFYFFMKMTAIQLNG